MPEWDALVRKDIRFRMWLIVIISISIYIVLLLEEFIDLPYLIFGGERTPINYHEMILEAMILLVLIVTLLLFYRSELNKRLDHYMRMQKSVEKEYRLNQKLELEKDLSARLLSIGYKYQHECQTPLVTLGGYFEAINSMCKDNDCPLVDDKEIIIKNIKKLHAINKSMANELNMLSNFPYRHDGGDEKRHN